MCILYVRYPFLLPIDYTSIRYHTIQDKIKMMLINKKNIIFKNDLLNNYSSYSILTQYILLLLLLCFIRFAIKTNSRLSSDIRYLYLKVLILYL